MKVEGTYTFQAPRDAVWQAILDPEVLGNVIPGGQELTQTGESQYAAKMKIRIGPVQGLFNGTVKLSEIVAPQSYHIQVDGKGAPGFVKGEGDLSLEDRNDQTLLHYSGDAQVGGRLASVGQRLMESSAQALIRQSLEALDGQIQARMTGTTGGAAPIAAPPSQVEFAAGVTRKMIADLVPPEERPRIVQAGLVIVAALIVLWGLSEWMTNRLAHRIADILEERAE